MTEQNWTSCTVFKRLRQNNTNKINAYGCLTSQLHMQEFRLHGNCLEVSFLRASQVAQW